MGFSANAADGGREVSRSRRAGRHRMCSLRRRFLGRWVRAAGAKCSGRGDLPDRCIPRGCGWAETTGAVLARTSTSPARLIRRPCELLPGFADYGPSSGKGSRAVPMAPMSASALAQLGQRSDWGGRRRPGVRPARPVATSTVRHCVAATSRRSLRGVLRPLRFHDLRHTFGTRMIAEADIRRVQEWDGPTPMFRRTMRYLHYAPRADGDRPPLVAKGVCPWGRLGTSWDL